MVVDQSDDIGGSAGEIITALRCKLKDVERQSSKSKCLICMVSPSLSVKRFDQWNGWQQHNKNKTEILLE